LRKFRTAFDFQGLEADIEQAVRNQRISTVNLEDQDLQSLDLEAIIDSDNHSTMREEEDITAAVRS